MWLADWLLTSGSKLLYSPVSEPCGEKVIAELIKLAETTLTIKLLARSCLFIH